MKLDEAKAQYLTSKANYADACLLCKEDRIANREQRFAAYNALTAAETDLIDLAFEQAEAATRTDKSELLNDILENSTLRRQVAELSLTLTERK